MLVRSPFLTSHKWRELVSSGHLVCRCHKVFLWCYLCLVLLRLCFSAFVKVAALRSIVLRYAGVPIATRVYLFSLFDYLEMSLSPSIFFPLLFSLCMESTPYVLSFRMVFFYLVTTGWIFGISLCENSINQSINQSYLELYERPYMGNNPLQPFHADVIIHLLLLLFDYFHASFLDRKVSLYWCAYFMPLT